MLWGGRRENTSTGVRGWGEVGKSIMKGGPVTLEGQTLGVGHSVAKARDGVEQAAMSSEGSTSPSDLLVCFFSPTGLSPQKPMPPTPKQELVFIAGALRSLMM